MHAGIRNDVFQSLELACNQCTMCPGTGVGNVKVVAILLRGKFAAFLYKIPELGLAAFELSRFIISSYPVCDFLIVSGLLGISFGRRGGCISSCFAYHFG